VPLNPDLGPSRPSRGQSGWPATWIVAHRKLIVVVWAAAALLLGAEARKLGSRLEASVRIEGSRSASIEADLATRFHSPYVHRLLLVVGGVPRPDTAEGREILEGIVRAVSEAPGVGGMLSFLDGADPIFLGRQTGTFLIVGLDPGSVSPESLVQQLREVTSLQLARIRVRHPTADLGWTGEVPLNMDLRRVNAEDARVAETRAIPAALALLLLAFGSLPAALLPLGVGALSVVLTLGAAAVLARYFQLSILVQNIASMIGLGLGIDYALLMVSRFRESLARGVGAEASAVEAARRAGHTILLSAVPVGIGFAVLASVPTSELRSIGVAGLLVTAATFLTSCTLLPAVLSWIGSGVNRGGLPGRLRRPLGDQASEAWRRWGRRMASHPVLALIIGGLPMMLLAAQVRRLETGTLGTSWLPGPAESVRALHALEDMGRSNLVHSLRLVLDLPPGAGVESEEGWMALRRLTKRLQADPRVERVHALGTVLGAGATFDRIRRLPTNVRRNLVSQDGRSALLEILPAMRPWRSERAEAAPAPASEREGLILLLGDAETLARELQEADAPRLTGLPGTALRVGGLPAANNEFQDAMESRFRRVVILVVLATFFALLLGFRYVLVAVKAVALNLLTVASSLGAVVLAFQDGYASHLLGLAEPTGRVFTIVPILVFGIVFGLSMDYEVFLVTRVVEGRLAGLSETEAIAEGVARTGRLITSAASIMVAVFSAFALGSLLAIKMIGFALAVAVLLDATVVRMVIGPALLALAGRWNWWPAAMDTQSSGEGT
jgi:putative drug exporter of the RND superfamily